MLGCVVSCHYGVALDAVPAQFVAGELEAWMTAEAAKRRLVHQLDGLALPIEIRSHSAPDGLAFDLVDLPGQGGITGHLEGIVTLDLAETDDQHRDDLRRQLGAPAVYAFEPTDSVVDKLAFVHQQVAAHVSRDRFYAEH